jgi:hypothetical protein
LQAHLANGAVLSIVLDAIIKGQVDIVYKLLHAAGAIDVVLILI